jgi:hypothetical protein
MTTVVVTSTITAYASETLFMPGIAWLTHRRHQHSRLRGRRPHLGGGTVGHRAWEDVT